MSERRPPRPAPGRRRGGSPEHDPQNPRGTAATGTVAKLFVGQGHGFIRHDGRDVFFHRRDLSEGTPFNEFAIGDAVAFELLEDKFSGPRALNVRRVSKR